MDKSMVPVTVLMPVYNAEPHLVRAVDSVLNQTFSDFEFLVINDGSTDHTREIVGGYDDPRIRIVDTPNRGVAAALRLGVELARGAYIARMDADDECPPDRLARQREVLDANPRVVLVYGAIELIDAEGRLLERGVVRPHTSAEAKWFLLWQNVPAHSSVMLRAATLRQNDLNYRLERNGAEDFDLWNRLVPCGEFQFVPEVLLRYREHGASVTKGDAPAPRPVVAEVIRDNLARYGVAASAAQATELAVVSGGAPIEPGAYRYPYLRGTLHRLADAAAAEFQARYGIAAAALAATRAEQYARWARSLGATSRAYAARLLWCGLRQRATLVFTCLFWTALFGMVLPESWLHRAVLFKRVMMSWVRKGTGRAASGVS